MNINCYINAKVYFKMACVRVRVSVRVRAYPHFPTTRLGCLTGLENGKQVVKRNGVVGHKSLSTKRLVVESLTLPLSNSAPAQNVMVTNESIGDLNWKIIVEVNFNSSLSNKHKDLIA